MNEAKKLRRVKKREVHIAIRFSDRDPKDAQSAGRNDRPRMAQRARTP